MYQDIRFNRAITPGKDYISPGSYEVTFQKPDGEKVLVCFDFEDTEWSVDDNDPRILHVMQKNPDFSAFPDLNKVTENMLGNVAAVNEWFIYIDTDDDAPQLTPESILACAFGLTNGKLIPMSSSLIESITPTCGQ